MNAPGERGSKSARVAIPPRTATMSDSAKRYRSGASDGNARSTRTSTAKLPSQRNAVHHVDAALTDPPLSYTIPYMGIRRTHGSFLNLSTRGGRWYKSVFAVLIGLTVAVALATPHFVRDHFFSLSVPVIQTIVLFVDLSLAAVFLMVLRRVVRREEEERRLLETRLDSSMRYIGRANTTLELFGEFVDSAAELESPRQLRVLMERLHHRIAVSVIDAIASRVRVISLVDGRTATEFEWSGDGITPPPRLSNRRIIDGDAGDHRDRAVLQIISDSARTGLVSVLVARTRDPDACDEALLKTLVNEFHLFYLIAAVHNRFSDASCSARDRDHRSREDR